VLARLDETTKFYKNYDLKDDNKVKLACIQKFEIGLEDASNGRNAKFHKTHKI
jgi:hypothetical protein